MFYVSHTKQLQQLLTRKFFSNMEHQDPKLPLGLKNSITGLYTTYLTSCITKLHANRAAVHLHQNCNVQTAH